LAAVVVAPQVEQRRPQQVEQVDQEVGLLGEMMAFGAEKEGLWALELVEQKEEGLNFPPPPPPQSPRAGETRSLQSLAVSSCGV